MKGFSNRIFCKTPCEEMNQSQRGILKVKVINENCKVIQSSLILSESCQSTAGCVADGRGLCQKNQEKQIWMKTHQYVCKAIRSPGTMSVSEVSYKYDRLYWES